MQKAGLNAVRLGDSAWSALQPSVGKFSLDWLKTVLDQFAEADISVVMATPTALPPVWLTSLHPDMRLIGEDDKPVLTESRNPVCITSPELHKAALHIVKTLAKQFGHHPAIIGWQVDNAFQRTCWCERCQKLFQEYLKNKYKTLKELNNRWCNRIRSQEYTQWEQIAYRHGSHHPAMLLEQKRFVSYCYEAYFSMLVNALRPEIPEEVWLTHNFLGLENNLNTAQLANQVDTAGLDWYIGRKQHDYRSSAATLAAIRGLKRRNFWVLEAQAGNVNWASISNMLEKGATRSMVWHAFANGTDGLLFWHWRPTPNGLDQQHGSLVNSAGNTRLIYDEIAQLGSELPVIQPLLQDSKVETEVAILVDTESRWSVDALPLHRDFNYTSFLQYFCRPLTIANVTFDVIPASSSLQGYKLVFVPALSLLSEDRVAVFTEFVRGGGHLVLTCRTGIRDQDNASLPVPPPAGLSELAGVTVEEAFALAEPIGVQASYFKGSAQIWAERLQALDENTIAISHYITRAESWLNNQLAMTVRSVGRGLVYYAGCWLDEASQTAFLKRVISSARIFPPNSPPGVSISERRMADGKVLSFVINHSLRTQQIAWSDYAQEHLTGMMVDGFFNLEPNGVAILTRAKKPPIPATSLPEPEVEVEQPADGEKDDED